jgi:hypothetical protein
VEQEGRVGGQEQNALLLPLNPGQGREAGPWKRRLPIPFLTLVGDGPWKWLLGVGRRPAMVVGVVVRGRSGKRRRLFIARKRRFGGEGGAISFRRPWRRSGREGQRRGRFVKNPSMDSAGEVLSGIPGAVLWDMTRRAVSWAMAATSGGVEWSALAVVEVTGRAGEVMAA